ncbi:MAG: hypothetical protein JXA33_14425 [Anaerolineae bacterium]|nr:hypothetical protein [Anaerolineae bacterium]
MAYIGNTLPAWSPGTLDLHHISTGRGDAAFYIFPDGTTLLVDAGELDPTAPRVTSPRNAPAKPDGTRPAYAWIARYIARMSSPFPEPVLDYALVTHYHDDHFGIVTPVSEPSASGAYKLTGITGVGEHIPIHTLLDRGYDYPTALNDETLLHWLRANPELTPTYRQFAGTMENYWAFIRWQQNNTGLQVEKFAPGRSDQIVLRHAPDSYPTFQVRNICSNGEVWTGRGTDTQRDFPAIADFRPQDFIDENLYSNGIHIRYGRFDYFTGGDIPGIVELDTPPWQDLETPVARAVGAVDALVLNHHGYRNTTNAFFVRTLSPRVILQQAWSADQPGQGVLRRLLSTYLYPGPRDLFSTAIVDATRIVLGEETIDRAYRSTRGHILVRVDPGGETYRVIILDDGAETFVVKAEFGPYEAKIK